MNTNTLPGSPGSGEPCYPNIKINCNESVGMMPPIAYNLVNVWSPVCHIFKGIVVMKFHSCNNSVGGVNKDAFLLNNIWDKKCNLFKNKI